MTFRDFCIDRHDNYSNQLYDEGFERNNLPYSFHLKRVLREVENHKFLFTNKYDFQQCIYYIAIGHDLLEDTRLSYNELVSELRLSFRYGNDEFAEEVANSIYNLTEFKGKNKQEKQNKQYWENIFNDKKALFVKLCDILANTKYSLLMCDDLSVNLKKINYLIENFYDPEFKILYNEIKYICEYGNQ